MTVQRSPYFNYGVITANYWAFTLTDGALRMLIVLYFYQQGFNALAIAFLFLFYEFFGVVTNLVGGWFGAKFGLNRTMNIGLLFQAVALAALLAPTDFLTVSWVMAAQALSGIAKDLNKMSAKSGIKNLLPVVTYSTNNLSTAENPTPNVSKNENSINNARLFKWVAALTGSKNTLKGIGFFLGGYLLWSLGFRGAIATLLAIIIFAGLSSFLFLPSELGKAKSGVKFKQLFSNSPSINYLSLARLFLFASRDVWFVVALPIYLSVSFNWSHSKIGAYFAIWVIGYGIVQSLTPALLKRFNTTINARLAFLWSLPLTLVMVLIFYTQWKIQLNVNAVTILLFLFGAIFAVNSAIHSYLIVHWARADGTSLDVGFYYMSNAAGRLTGTVLSGYLYLNWGLTACLACAAMMLITVPVSSYKLQRVATAAQ